MSRKNRNLERIILISETTGILTHEHVNGWEPAVYMSCMSQKFPFVSLIEFIRYKLSIFSVPASGVSDEYTATPPAGPATPLRVRQ